MKSEQVIQDEVRTIISFTDSYTQNKERKQNEQSESDSILSLTEVIYSLQSISYQIRKNKSCKSVIKNQKLLHSLTSLSIFKLGTHINKQVDGQRFTLRIQSELVNNEYGRVMFISYSTAGGIGEEQNQDIYDGLMYIYNFLRELHEGRNNSWQPSFQPLPLLARRIEEQIEEEGGNEELEAQTKNSGDAGNIKYLAKWAKAATMNHFINNN
ncbi:MAG: hypothetical protein EZS28_007476 [Streblomastix strix]|uniref:Uncharacterized protein n=1 Tax=Streblomastix strix TaxID=222440 RepID=A0A5J4WR14_9EUKA|nr:MAG: hypothetical protein EZS28_007476 [Streblomastix strix]